MEEGKVSQADKKNSLFVYMRYMHEHKENEASLDHNQT